MALQERHCPESNQKAVREVGLVDFVFPHGRDCDGAKNGEKSFQDKLREFIHYQPLTSFGAPDIPEGIKLSSPEGRQMLLEALQTPYMEAFYTVSPQIDNQPPCCCGSMSLVVALNSLAIDPGYADFSEEWRWNTLESLSCCTAILQAPDICLDQFGCLAVCNGARAFPKMVTDSWSLDDLRCWVKMALSRSDMVMVINHGRQEMNQKGSGHYLPLTGYHEGKDMFLSYDIAKHKYPTPQWLPLHKMLTAINARDTRSGLHRGFCLLMRPDYESSEKIFDPSIVFRIDDEPGKSDPRLKTLMGKLNRMFDEKVPKHASHQDIIKSAIDHFVSVTRLPSIDNGKSSVIPIWEMTLRHFRNHSNGEKGAKDSVVSSIIARCRIPQCHTSCPNTPFIQQIESLGIFQLVCEVIKSLSQEERSTICDLIVSRLDGIDDAVRYTEKTSHEGHSMLRTINFFKTSKRQSHDASSRKENGISHDRPTVQCPGYIELFPEHILTFLLISWPYHEYDDMFGHDAFIQVLADYQLPHLNHSNEEMATKHDVKRSVRDENHNTEEIQGNHHDNEASLRNQVDQIVCEDLDKFKHYRILHEQIRSIKRKIRIVLEYHNMDSTDK